MSDLTKFMLPIMLAILIISLLELIRWARRSWKKSAPQREFRRYFGAYPDVPEDERVFVQRRVAEKLTKAKADFRGVQRQFKEAKEQQTGKGALHDLRTLRRVKKTTMHRGGRLGNMRETAVQFGYDDIVPEPPEPDLEREE